MNLWFDRNDVDFKAFCSEQFLLMPLFNDTVLTHNKDFVNCVNWKKDIENIVKFTDIENCDFILFPNKLNNNIYRYLELSKKYNKKIIVFYNDDNDAPIALDKSIIVFRTSFYRSKKKINEFAMPAWSRDFNDYEAFKTRVKNKLPTVSFCGYISHPIRKTCLEFLKTNTNIEKEFIIRDMFWGGRIHDDIIRNDYVKSIVNSDMVLCTRGAGNFSYRFYETLSCGRIPVLVDTDCVLPCEDAVMWKDMCVYVSDPKNINEAIFSFWNNLELERYKELQTNIRHIYETYISPSGFAKYLETFKVD
jgi:hypothetical protein